MTTPPDPWPAVAEMDIVERLRDAADMQERGLGLDLHQAWMREAAAEIDALRDKLEMVKDAEEGRVPWSDECIAEIDALEEKWDIDLCSTGFAGKHWRGYLKEVKRAEAAERRVGVLSEALALLVRDLEEDYPASARPVHAVDVARTALASGSADRGDEG